MPGQSARTAKVNVAIHTPAQAGTLSPDSSAPAICLAKALQEEGSVGKVAVFASSAYGDLYDDRCGFDKRVTWQRHRR